MQRPEIEKDAASPFLKRPGVRPSLFTIKRPGVRPSLFTKICQT
jgi:hypothetical protein